MTDRVLELLTAEPISPTLLEDIEDVLLEMFPGKYLASENRWCGVAHADTKIWLKAAITRAFSDEIHDRIIHAVTVTYCQVRPDCLLPISPRTAAGLADCGDFLRPWLPDSFIDWRYFSAAALTEVCRHWQSKRIAMTRDLYRHLSAIYFDTQFPEADRIALLQCVVQWEEYDDALPEVVYDLLKAHNKQLISAEFIRAAIICFAYSRRLVETVSAPMTRALYHEVGYALATHLKYCNGWAQFFDTSYMALEEGGGDIDEDMLVNWHVEPNGVVNNIRLTDAILARWRRACAMYTLAVIVALCDDYLTLAADEKILGSFVRLHRARMAAARRFFGLAQRLPYELQIVLALRLFELGGTVLVPKESAWRWALGIWHFFIHSPVHFIH